jgi:outer membrane protein OmpU
LASASIFAFAGAAAADHVSSDDLVTETGGIKLTGDAEIGYNDDIEDGFYGEGNLGITALSALNNNLLAALTFGIDLEDFGDDDFGGGDFGNSGSSTISLTDMSGLSGVHFGDTQYAAEKHWESIDLLGSDEFSEQDEEVVLRGDYYTDNWGASLSYNVADADGDGADDVDQLSLGASGTFDRFNFRFGYQEESDAFVQPVGASDIDGDGPLPPVANDDPDEEDTSVAGLYDTDEDDDFTVDEIIAVGGSTTLFGLDVLAGYANDTTINDESLGFGARFPFGPVTLGAYYIFEFDDDIDGDGNGEDDSWRVDAAYVTDRVDAIVFYESDKGDEDLGVEVDYSVNEDLLIRAGYIDSTEGYIGADYDLGNGAGLRVSYADQDEEGRPEYKQGTTVAMTFNF